MQAARVHSRLQKFLLHSVSLVSRGHVNAIVILINKVLRSS